MILRGRAHKFGDNINTDYIISGKYKFKTLDMNELAKHVMEDVDPHFCEKVKPGDFIVAGRNFGCGSSREQAPRALWAAGIQGGSRSVFCPRIFFRNAINCGLAALECDTSPIEDGDELEIDLLTGKVVDHSQGIEIKTQLPASSYGGYPERRGLNRYFKKYGSFQGVRK